MMFSKIDSAVVKLRSELGSVLHQNFSIEPSNIDNDSPYNLKIQEVSGEVVFCVIPERLNGHNYLTVQSKEFPEFKSSRRLDRSMDRLARKIGNDLLKKSLKKANLARGVVSSNEEVEYERERLADSIMETYAKHIQTKVSSTFTMKSLGNSKLQTKIDLTVDEETGCLNVGLELNNLSEKQLGALLKCIFDQGCLDT